MLIPYSWLTHMVDAPDDIEELCSRLALTGTEIEGVHTEGANLEHIVVGHILTREKHPDAEHLWVTTVDVGEHNLGEDGAPEALQIVCGAQNFVAGDKVPVALVGAVMPDGTKIKKSKLRGIPSCGMNCSGRELGVSDDHEGLLILPADAPVGMPIARYLNLSETVIDAEITPNRPDCMSVLGVAREVGAIYDTDLHYTLPRAVCTGPSVSDFVTVSIEDPQRCPRYTARVIRGAKIGPSPEWLAKWVTAAGARSINNIVDVTNYILFGLGQPLHAFDLGKLAKDADGKAHVIVRAAVEGESFTTLDGIERVLTADMTVIADGNAVAVGAGASADAGAPPASATGASAVVDVPVSSSAGLPIALAGVMGGLESEISESTVDILLESATFSSAHTSRTSRNLQLFSESSQRYERGVDAASCDDFSLAAAALMVEVAGGEICEGAVDVYPLPALPSEMIFRIPRFCRFIGATVPVEDIERILQRLGCTVERVDNAEQDALPATIADDDAELETTVLRIVAPTFRPDLTREVDLYEEVLRVWGMERVPATLPGGRGRIGGLTVEQQRIARIGETLRACGLNETMTYSFVAPDDLSRLRMPEEGRGEAVELINPMSVEQSVMRRSIIPGLLHSVAYNQNHGSKDIHLYEIGAVFAAAEGRKLPKERKLVAGVLAGAWNETGWNQPRVELDFFDGKGVLENLFRELCVSKVRFKALDSAAAPWLQPGRAAEVYAGGSLLGWVGEIHPLACKDFEAEVPVVAFELELAPLLKACADVRPFKDIPHVPAVEMDLAIVVDESVSAEKVQQVLSSAGGNLLESVRLFDVYRDPLRVGHGRKSLAFSLSYRAADRTLTSEEVDKAHEKVIQKVCKATGGEVRG